MKHTGYTPEPFKEEILTRDLESILSECARLAEENERLRAACDAALHEYATRCWTDPASGTGPFQLLRAALAETKD